MLISLLTISLWTVSLIFCIGKKSKREEEVKAKSNLKSKEQLAKSPIQELPQKQTLNVSYIPHKAEPLKKEESGHVEKTQESGRTTFSSAENMKLTKYPKSCKNLPVQFSKEPNADQEVSVFGMKRAESEVLRFSGKIKRKQVRSTDSTQSS